MEILDVAIGLFFMYLLLSLVCTGIMEYFAALTNKRGKELVAGIEQLLKDTKISDAFYSHPLIQSFYPYREAIREREAKLSEKSWVPRPVRRFFTWLRPSVRKLRRPSYLPARAFAMVLTELVGYPPAAAKTAPGGQESARPVVSPELRRLLGTLEKDSVPDVTEFANLDLAAALAGSNLSEEVKARFMDGFVGARKELHRLHDSVEVWYNNAMDRISGSYKRWTQWWLFVIGVVVALLVNADTIRVWNTLAEDDDLREELVARAAQTLQDTTLQRMVMERREVPSLDTARTEIQWVRREMEEAQIPLGWTREEWIRLGVISLKDPKKPAGEWKCEWPWDASLNWPWRWSTNWNWGPIFSKLFGLLVTAVALSLGAPFWFDTLNKIISIRGAGRAPQEEPSSPEAPGKRPAGQSPK